MIREQVDNVKDFTGAELDLIWRAMFFYKSDLEKNGIAEVELKDVTLFLNKIGQMRQYHSQI